GDIDENTLRLYISSDNGNTWGTVFCNLNTVDNIISGTITHLSIIALAGVSKQVAASDLTRVIAYPNPCKNYDKITFGNLTDQCKISIYSIAGELVYEKELTNTKGSEDWYLMNKSGKKVASGVYIYIITNNQKQKPATGKIGIIR
ncbi:MAG: T9SS type A sorting domain-containing protein, partial [bacterium]|nr:T9SS type A sorting domain-containing protein [bacterium]